MHWPKRILSFQRNSLFYDEVFRPISSTGAPSTRLSPNLKLVRSIDCSARTVLSNQPSGPSVLIGWLCKWRSDYECNANRLKFMRKDSLLKSAPSGCLQQIILYSIRMRSMGILGQERTNGVRFDELANSSIEEFLIVRIVWITSARELSVWNWAKSAAIDFRAIVCKRPTLTQSGRIQNSFSPRFSDLFLEVSVPGFTGSSFPDKLLEQSSNN